MKDRNGYEMSKKQLDFDHSSRLLSQYGIEALGAYVFSEDEAVAQASKMGYPVAVKSVSQKIIHKTDEGAVFLDVQNDQDLQRSCAELKKLMGGFSREEGDGILVQGMAPKGLEILVGSKRDPGFGAVTMIGIGGIFVELYSDAAMGIGVLNRDDVLGMLANTQVGIVLEGYRGKSYDREAVIDVAIKISRLMHDNPKISELDLNPVIVHETGCSIVDVRIIRDDKGIDPVAEDVKPWVMESINAIFRAESVAVIGASRPGTQGGVILKNCIGIKRLYPVHPTLEKIHGIPCYTSLAELPEVPAVGVFAVNSERTVSIFRDFCELGGKGAIIFSDGFAEMGRSELEEELLKISEEYKVAYIGPNCMGVIDSFSGLNTNYIPEQRSVTVEQASGIGVISQSGGIGLELLEMFRADHQNLGRWVSIGNASCAGVPEMLAQMGDDPRISIIAIYLEGVADGLKLMKVGREVTAKKPVIIIKGGTGGGAEAALSHTASLAGSHEAFQACCEQAGFYLVEDLTEDPKILVNILSILTSQPQTGNDRVAVVSVGGGAGILLADQVTEEGMRLAQFSQETRRKLQALIGEDLYRKNQPPNQSVLDNIGNNPLDLFGNCNDERLLAALRIIDEDSETDVIVAGVYLQVPLLSEYLPERLVELNDELTKPLIVSPRGFSQYVDRCRTYMATKKLRTYTVPMMKPLGIALRIWKRYGRSFME